MKSISGQIILKGLSGNCGSKQVFLGFAPAHLLFALSKSDVLDESTGKGYQRKFNAKHSLDFRKYIQKQNSCIEKRGAFFNIWFWYGTYAVTLQQSWI